MSHVYSIDLSFWFAYQKGLFLVNICVTYFLLKLIKFDSYSNTQKKNFKFPTKKN